MRPGRCRCKYEFELLDVEKENKVAKKFGLKEVDDDVSLAELFNPEIEFTDNKISLYAAQYGKCAVLGIVLDIDDIHCHHKLPKKSGGKDNYQNLIIIHQDVHRLIHATQDEIISKYLHTLKLDKQQISKVNKLRKMVGNETIKWEV